MNKKFNKLRLLYSLLIFSLVLITAYLIDLKQENKQKNAEIKLINVNVEPSNDTIVVIKNSGLKKYKFYKIKIVGTHDTGNH
jgi:hypothetical protein